MLIQALRYHNLICELLGTQILPCVITPLNESEVLNLILIRNMVDILETA
ncbi:unnamed protein product [Moneuplotes crassus]|uniref:Uncharacterized protein n=1 Tax=Euplotes crassus TaxID=5936 RepID=A0AAD1Y0J9_EUPCR|nr:unnamed protein product [Moneuplotes crassus]